MSGERREKPTVRYMQHFQEGVEGFDTDEEAWAFVRFHLWDELSEHLAIEEVTFSDGTTLTHEQVWERWTDDDSPGLPPLGGQR